MNSVDIRNRIAKYRARYDVKKRLFCNRTQENTTLNSSIFKYSDIYRFSNLKLGFIYK